MDSPTSTISNIVLRGAFRSGNGARVFGQQRFAVDQREVDQVKQRDGTVKEQQVENEEYILVFDWLIRIGFQGVDWVGGLANLVARIEVRHEAEHIASARNYFDFWSIFNSQRIHRSFIDKKEKKLTEHCVPYPMKCRYKREPDWVGGGYSMRTRQPNLSINFIVFMLKILMIALLMPLRNTNEKSCLKKNGPILWETSSV